MVAINVPGRVLRCGEIPETLDTGPLTLTPSLCRALLPVLLGEDRV